MISARAKARAFARSNPLRLSAKFLPLAEVAETGLPVSRIVRLSLLQVSVGMALVLLTGTLNRVMIIELGVAAKVVATMVALPVLFAPARLLIGFRSDHHRSVLGWRRIPYIWFGTMAQFGGLAIMPFALIILSGDTSGPLWVGTASAALAFLLLGAGIHTVQTAGLALANDIVSPETRPKVVAALYVSLLSGMVGSALVFGFLLSDFSQVRLIQVIQGSALFTMVANIVALWKQEAFQRVPDAVEETPPPRFREVWRSFSGNVRLARFLTAVALGSMAFSMQDILLEPYGGEILGLSVGATTALTAIYAGGALAAFLLAAKLLAAGANPNRLSAYGGLIGIFAFSLVVFAAPLDSALCFRSGTLLIGFGGGLFCVGSLTAAMALGSKEMNGFALGAWGAVHATAVGMGIAAGGIVRDVVSAWAISGALGPGLTDPVTGYTVVYHMEIALLFAMLVAIGPLVTTVRREEQRAANARFGLTEFPSI